jgi:hypothetical protein
MVASVGPEDACGAAYQEGGVWSGRAWVDRSHADIVARVVGVCRFYYLTALTTRLNGEPALIARVSVIAAFLGLGYFTYDPE